MTTAIKTWTNERFLSTDINAEFQNVYNNMMDLSSAQTKSGRLTLSGGLVLDELVVTTTAGAGDIKLTEFRWDPASGTVTDADGMYIPWMSDDDGGNDTEYGRQHLEFVDTGAASEDAAWVFSAITAASLTTALTMSSATAAFNGIVTATTVEPTGDTAAGDNAALGYTATEGAILTGQGSTYDVVIKNDADGNVMQIATGTTTATFPGATTVTGDATAATFLATGDTAAGDNAALGYTATEGAILTGQGSTSDVTLKNDADGTVLSIPTGTTKVGIGTTAAESTVTMGLTLEQLTNTDRIMTFKSTGSVDHGMTTRAETSTYGAISKVEANSGGLRIAGWKDADDTNAFAVYINGELGEAADTTHSNAGVGIIHIAAAIKDGAGLANPTANGNILCVAGDGTQFIVDAEGDLFANSGTSTTAVTVYDDHPDAVLCRAFDMTRAPEHIIRTKFDEFVGDREAQLVQMGVLGDTMANGGLVNVTRLQLLHNGAIWQTHMQVQELREALDEKDTKIMALEQRLNLLEIPSA